jgi:hypothetical protein
MDFLVEDALFRELVIELLLGRNLELSIQPLALIVVVLMVVVVVTVATCTSNRLIGQGVQII